jgi:hypothetical protein
MIYPLIEQKKKIHIVKDVNSCECGLKYHSDLVIKRKTLKQIKFVELGKVTCKKCASKLTSND